MSDHQSHQVTPTSSRVDLTTAQIVDIGIELQKTRGAPVAAAYLTLHRLNFNITVRVLGEPRHRRPYPSYFFSKGTHTYVPATPSDSMEVSSMKNVDAYIEPMPKGAGPTESFQIEFADNSPAKGAVPNAKSSH
jgi:hypothetical protein